MSDPVRYELIQRSRVGHARLGRVHTPHGAFDTPAFMPVGTQGTVKGHMPRDVGETGAQILLNNTFHLMLRPGDELVKQLGGAHRFMNWNGPILTDSGGFQAYSMADINAIDEDGVTFRSVINGAEIHLPPERAIHGQNNLGADIIMAFDDCPPAEDPSKGPLSKTKLRLAAQRQGLREYDHGRRLDDATERTTRWRERCVRAHQRPQEQALFGIVQGGTDEARRARSLEQVCNIELPGYAVGGVAVGESPTDIARVVHFTAPKLPESKPRYLMGVGYERDILTGVLAGIDMFDCVLPTRNGRSATAFTRSGPLRLKNARYAEDTRPIEEGCDCHACMPGRFGGRGEEGSWFSRAYLRHLFAAEEMLGPILVSLHNLRHFQRLMLDIRRAIAQDAWSDLAADWPILRGTSPSALAVGPLATLPAEFITSSSIPHTAPRPTREAAGS